MDAMHRLPRKIRRKEILTAAKQAFLAEGYGASNIETIAKHAGVSKPTVYKHFESKIDLFTAMIKNMVEGLEIGSEEALEKCKKLPPKEGLKFLGHKLVGAIYQPEIIQLYRLVISESRQFPEMNEALALCCCNYCYDHCRALLESYCQKGLAKIDDLDIACNQFLLLLEEPVLYALVMRREALPGQIERTQIIERTVDIFWTYYAKK